MNEKLNLDSGLNEVGVSNTRRRVVSTTDALLGSCIGKLTCQQNPPIHDGAGSISTGEGNQESSPSPKTRRARALLDTWPIGPK
jgi:hypothetical protein